MNFWILSAGFLAFLTSLIHIFAGQVDPVRPFLKSNLSDVPKATLLACWHMVSVILVLCSLVLLYIGWFNLSFWFAIVAGIALSFILFALVFIVVGWFFFGMNVFIKLPQWILLLGIGSLGLLGIL